RDE
ncbi:acetyl-CoA C-acetyltransferase family protein, partial [Escherichia coli 89.0511]